MQVIISTQEAEEKGNEIKYKTMQNNLAISHFASTVSIKLW